jgi:hypothetical protein
VLLVNLIEKTMISVFDMFSIGIGPYISPTFRINFA